MTRLLGAAALTALATAATAQDAGELQAAVLGIQNA